MEYRKLGSTGLKVSEICFGTATFGWHTDDAESELMLDLFLDRGGNFIDTADIYSGWAEGSWVGRSEEMIGTWLKKTGRRHEIVLATKCRSAMGDLPNDQGLSRRHIVDAVEAIRICREIFCELLLAIDYDASPEMGCNLAGLYDWCIRTLAAVGPTHDGALLDQTLKVTRTLHEGFCVAFGDGA